MSLSESVPLFVPFLPSHTQEPLARSQGYAFKVITSLEGLEQLDNLVYPTRAEQIELLQSVLLANETDADLGAEDTGKEVGTSRYNSPAPGPGGLQATRIAGSLQALSGCVVLAFETPHPQQR